MFKENILVMLFIVLSVFSSDSVIVKAQPLESPVKITLDFLKFFKKDTGWLREKLIAHGFATGKYRIEESYLESSEVEVISYVNRIRTFAYLNAVTTQLPYFNLQLKGQNGGLVRCVTLFPRSIVPQLKAMDFQQAEFSSEDADATILDQCRVVEQPDVVFKGFTRTAFKEKFFDKYGDLKIDFVKLNRNPAFIATAIDLGFFVVNQDYTGRLRIDI